MKHRLRAIRAEDFHAAGVKAAALLKTLPFWHEYHTFLVFVSMPNEIDTLPLIEAALAAGKNVFAPRVEAAARQTGPAPGSKPEKKIRFYRIRSAAGPWEQGSFGIREPAHNSGDSRALEPGDFPALVLCPGLAFDREGGRLGYGGGFYDRFLAEQEALACSTLGLCLECQLVDRVPAEGHDRKTTAVLTETEYRQTR
jgi:5-formyltetrahydrofolate cyclo-ligase